MLQPALHKDKLNGLYNIVIALVETCINCFPEGDSVDVFPLLQQLSFRMLLQSLFDIALSDDLITELGNIFTELQDFLFKDINHSLRKFFNPATGLKETSMKQSRRLRGILSRIIAERRKNRENNNDRLDMLLNSRYEDTDECVTVWRIIISSLR